MRPFKSLVIVTCFSQSLQTENIFNTEHPLIETRHIILLFKSKEARPHTIIPSKVYISSDSLFWCSLALSLSLPINIKTSCKIEGIMK